MWVLEPFSDNAIACFCGFFCGARRVAPGMVPSGPNAWAARSVALGLSFPRFCTGPAFYGAFFAHFSIVPALWAPQDRAAKTNCRRLGRQVAFFKLKNALWGHFFEAPDFLDFQGPQILLLKYRIFRPGASEMENP